MHYLMRNVVLPGWEQENSEPDRIFNVPNKRGLLERLSRLNVFIGPNNCGKSRLLRTLFQMLATDGSEYTPALPQVMDLYRECDKWVSAAESAPDELIDKDQREETIGALSRVGPPLKRLGGNETRADSQLTKLASRHNVGAMHIDLKKTSPELVEFPVLEALYKKAKSAIEEQPACSPMCVYIPALRSLRKVGDINTIPSQIAKDHFSSSTELVYPGNSHGDDNVRLDRWNLLCGSEFYEGIRDFLLGSRQQREAIRNFEEYLSLTFFDGKAVSIIPRTISEVLYIKIGTEEERPIHELGDGLAQIVILTLPLFIHQDKPLLLFIEEPELYMHPGFQRAFIDAVLNTENGVNRQVFVATHSHQFLDITIDRDLCSVYRIEKLLTGDDPDDKQARHEISLASSDNFPLLRELGVRNSSVLLSNCTIWVEGITDRLYFRHYLKVYQESLPLGSHHFLEDVHFSFVEYSGGNITHWSFLDSDEGIDADRLCGRLMLIADSDDVTEGSEKEKRHKQLEAVLGNRFICLSCREVENLLTPSVIRKVIREYEGADVKLNSFEQDDYRDKYLGGFIEDEVLAETSTRRVGKEGRPYAKAKKGSKGSTTIKDKVPFCNKAIPNIQTVTDLSDEALSTIQSIYEFIEEQNT